MALVPFVNRRYSHNGKRAKLSVARGVFPEFDSGDNWESYSRQLEEHFAENSITDDNKQVAVLLTVMSPSAYEVLKDACHPELPQLKTYAQLSKLLETHFSQQALQLVFKERITFHQAVQADAESVNEWLARVMNLAVFCEFDEHLDIMLRDKFISGLADKSIVNRFCTENCMAALTMRNIVDIASRMESAMQKPGQKESSSSKQKKQPQRLRATNILDISDELLIEIIFHLNARERVPLGNTCRRFNTLVFKDAELLKDLNFSKNGYLTSVSDIQQYFCNEGTVQRIRRVNLRNVRCLKPSMLHTFIGKAINLVDIHIHGTTLENICELATFLNPLQHVRRLSIDWPPTNENDISFSHQVLREPFSRLTYLSVNLDFCHVKTLLLSLQLFQELRELCIKIDEVDHPMAEEFGDELELEELGKLEVVQYFGFYASYVKDQFIPMLPDFEKWTQFELRSTLEFDDNFYLEKNAEVCTELAASKWLANVPNVEWSDRHLGRVLFPERLLTAVLKITHENVPDQLCCLSTFVEGYRCILNIADAKGLMKNPRHPISYLYMKHDIERCCDVHLIACAFPSLTELYLSNIITNKLSNGNEPHSFRCLKKRGTATFEEQGESITSDSSFKMLIDYTPHLKHLTVGAESITRQEYCWDLDALYLIPNWKCLETLCLWNVPIEHGEFLVDIGKGCENLQKLELNNLGGYSEPWCYKEGLFEMLLYCRNLKQFSVNQREIGQAPEMLALLLNNLRLKRVSVTTVVVRNSITDLISSIERLLYRCPEFATFICATSNTTSADYDELRSAVLRLKGQFIRRNLQMRIHVYPKSGKPSFRELSTIQEDTYTP